jgi:hypothetical protein
MPMPGTGGASSSRTVEVNVPSGAVLVQDARVIAASFIAEDDSEREGVLMVLDGRVNGDDGVRLHLLLDWPTALEIAGQVHARH